MSPRGARSRRAMALLIVVALVAACSPSSPSSPSTAADTPMADAVELELWYQPNGLHPERIMDAEIERFEQEHPDIRVDARMIGWDETLTKLATATRSGAVPDVTFVGSTWLSDLDVDGAFHAFEEDEIERLGGADRFHAAPWASGVDREGAVIGIPWLVETRLLFYRTDVLGRAGLDPTRDLRDWETFERSLASIRAETDVQPWGIPGRNDWNVLHNALAWIYASGGAPVDAEGRSTLTSPEVLRGLSELQRLVVRYGDRAALATDATGVQDGFVAGDYAMTINGPWLAQTLTDQLPDGAWGVEPLPAGPAGTATMVGGTHLAVLADTDHLDAATELVAFFTRPDSQARVAEQVSMVPARVDADLGGPEADAVRAALEAADTYPRLAGWTEIEHTLQRSFSRMWASVEQGTPLTDDELLALLEDASDQVSAVLDGPDG